MCVCVYRGHVNRGYDPRKLSFGLRSSALLKLCGMGLDKGMSERSDFGVNAISLLFCGILK